MQLCPGFMPAPLILLAIGAQSSTTASAQPLDNPGFEGSYLPLGDPACPGLSGAVAPGWQDNSCYTGNQGVDLLYTRETADRHSGSAAQRIAFSGGGVAQFVQPIEVVSGRKYTAAIWMRSPPGAKVILALRQAGPPYLNYSRILVRPTATWARYELTCLTETGDALFMIILDTPGTVVVDDATFASSAWVPSVDPVPVSAQFFGMHVHHSDIPWPAHPFDIGGARV